MNILRYKDRSYLILILFLWEVLDEIVFSSLIAFNEMLTSHCYNLSTHHYHPTNHPRFDTQFRHSETTQQHFCAVARSFRKKRKRSTLPFCTKEIGKKMTSTLFWQGLGLQENGILANVLKDPQQLNGPESNLYCYTSQLKYVFWLDENVSRAIGQNYLTP